MVSTWNYKEPIYLCWFLISVVRDIFLIVLTFYLKPRSKIPDILVSTERSIMELLLFFNIDDISDFLSVIILADLIDYFAVW